MSRLWKGGGNYFVCIYCIGTELHLQFALRCVVLCCVVLCCGVEWSAALCQLYLNQGIQLHYVTLCCGVECCAMFCVMSTLPQPKNPVALRCVTEWSALLRCAMSCVMSTLPQPRYPVALETQIFG